MLGETSPPLDKWNCNMTFSECSDCIVYWSTSGIGGIPTELGKYGTDIHELMRSLFAKCLNGKDVPEDRKVGFISTVHKKGRKDECKNYRGITVANIFSRFYGSIIK